MKTMRRRQLLGLARGSAKPEQPAGSPPPPKPFSMASFYEGRATSGSTTPGVMPRFVVKHDAPDGVVETSAVGVTIEAPRPPWESKSMPAASGLFVARIQAHACVAKDSFCDACRERCPEEGAIEIIDRLPRVVEELCTGCAQCVPACPAPGHAIVLQPKPSEGS